MSSRASETPEAVTAPSHRFATEFQSLLKLGAPMVATQFFIMAMGFLDTAMAGRYDSAHLAGVALGGMIMWPVFMMTSGFNMALTPIVAQLRGAGEVSKAGVKIRQGLWIALFSSILCVLVMLNAAPVLAWIGADPEAARVAEEYLRAAAWGLPPVQLYVALRYTSEGLGRTLPPMIIAGIALPVNGLLNYIFIYGEFGAPELGGVGCGWATAIVMWMELGLILTLLRTPYFKATDILSRFDWPQWPEIRSILKIGVPIGVTVFLEMAVFSTVGMSIASLGVVALAANSIAGNVNWATYVIPMSLGSAASIRVGFYVGAGDYGHARYVARTAFVVSLGYALVLSVLLVLGRQAIAGLYSEDPAVLQLAGSLIIFIAIYQIADDTLATISGTLRGYKDTRVPMVFTLVGFWLLAIPLGAGLCFGWFGFLGYDEPLGVQGYWIGMTLGLSVVAACMGWRLASTSGNLDRIRAFAAI